jgi:hypothetical protein
LSFFYLPPPFLLFRPLERVCLLVQRLLVLFFSFSFCVAFLRAT